MPDLGRALLFLALLTAVYGVGAAVYGARSGRREWVHSARRAAYALAGLVTAAFALLEIAFLRSDFNLEVVWSHSSTTTPPFYRLAAAWSSQEGSLLLWLWLLSLASALVLFLTRRRLRDVQPYAIAVLMGFAVFFAGLLVFAVSPFQELAVTPAEGVGLNPLLRHPAMMAHPPMLYAGYTLWAVPFAFAVGALIVRRVDAEWIVATRRFALAAWLFLGVGILLGARWSYSELGWGGYWAWDPVENASLLPWLTGTAFIHSVMVQEKRGMLKTWNASLILATGTLAILGTFLVRSGVLDSIHAFTDGGLGWPFITLICVMLAGSIYLVTTRRDALRSENRLDSLLSREAMFLANNLVLVAFAFVVFWGTFFPLISEALSGEKQTLGPPWYDKYIVPLALVLVALTGLGPAIPWRRATRAAVRRAFTVPAAAGVAAGVLAALLGAADHLASLALFALAGFAGAIAIQEFVRGIRARRAMTGEAPPLAFVSLVRRNRRRYGGYIVHLGIVVLFVGVAASSAFQEVHDERMRPGETREIGSGYSVRYERPTSRIDIRGDDVERIVFGAQLTLLKDGRKVGELRPERGYYPIQGRAGVAPLSRYFDGEATSEVAMRPGLFRDVWTAVMPDVNELLKTVREGDRRFEAAAGKLPEEQYARSLGLAVRRQVDTNPGEAPPATFRLMVSPLVAWIWIGSLIAFAGGLIAVWPASDLARRRATAGYAARVARELGRA